MLAGVAVRGADAVIADLEDAVAPVSKAWLAELQEPNFEAWVRINSAPGLRDVDAAVAGASVLAGLMVPKIHGAEELFELSAHVSEVEAAAGLPPGRTRLLPIIETSRAMRSIDEIAAAPRVHQLMIGEYDLGAELGIEPTATEAFMPFRMELVVASAAAGIAPPLGPVRADFHDLEGLAVDTRRLAGQGFGSRPAIHPAQVAVINTAFTPRPDEVTRARRLVEMYEGALAAGRGTATDDDGRMVDEAVVRLARRVLEAARRGEAAQ
jgi:citrate lyase subunit beta/citryl-CoA lyase